MNGVRRVVRPVLSSLTHINACSGSGCKLVLRALREELLEGGLRGSFFFWRHHADQVRVQEQPGEGAVVPPHPTMDPHVPAQRHHSTLGLPHGDAARPVRGDMWKAWAGGGGGTVKVLIGRAAVV